MITYKLEPNGQRHQIQVTPNKLGYYLSTYTTHPGRRYTVTVAALTRTSRGPDSDPVTVRSGIIPFHLKSLHSFLLITLTYIQYV